MFQAGKTNKLHIYILCKMTVALFRPAELIAERLRSCAGSRRPAGALLVRGLSRSAARPAVPVPGLCRSRGCAGPGAVPGAPGRGAEPGRRSPGSPGRQAAAGVAGAGVQNCRCAFSGSAHFTPPCNFPGLLNSPLDFSGRILLPIEFSRALSYLGQNFSGARVCARHAGNSPFATYISHACENIFAVFARKAQIL